MESIEIKVKDPIGLHARPAAIIVKEASKFSADIQLCLDEKTANLKSIMNVLALGVKFEDVITIKATGSDEKEAINAIKKAMTDNKLA